MHDYVIYKMLLYSKPQLSVQYQQGIELNHAEKERESEYLVVHIHYLILMIHVISSRVINKI